MDEHINSESIKKAQQASLDKSHDKFWRINTLPSEVHERVYEQLKRHSPRTVAELLQEDGYHTDIKAITLAHILEKFRSQKIPRHQLLNAYVVERIAGDMRKNVNVLAELSDMIMLQRERIRRAVLEEEETGELLPETNKQLHLQNRLLKTYGDLGIKSGLMSEFIRDFMTESQLAEEAMTLETRHMFLRYFVAIAQGNGFENVLDAITNLPEDPLGEE